MLQRFSLFFPSSVSFTDHHRRGLPGAHEPSALKLPVQPVPECSLQGGWDLSVRGCCQHVAHRLGKVLHRSPSAKFLICVCTGELQWIHAAYQLHGKTSQRDRVQVSSHMMQKQQVYTRNLNLSLFRYLFCLISKETEMETEYLTSSSERQMWTIMFFPVRVHVCVFMDQTVGKISR